MLLAHFLLFSSFFFLLSFFFPFLSFSRNPQIGLPRDAPSACYLTPPSFCATRPTTCRVAVPCPCRAVPHTARIQSSPVLVSAHQPNPVQSSSSFSSRAQTVSTSVRLLPASGVAHRMHDHEAIASIVSLCHLSESDRES